MNPFTENPLNHRLAEGVRRVGFRKWYERELLSSHAHLLLLLLASVGLMASFELFRGGTLSEKLLNVLFIVVCAGVGVWALRRYLYLLMHAEEIANQATCPSCQTYGRFALVRENRRDSEVMVRCKKCQHDWPIYS